MRYISKLVLHLLSTNLNICYVRKRIAGIRVLDGFPLITVIMTATKYRALKHQQPFLQSSKQASKACESP